VVDAALDELRDSGYEGLTVRNAARRAGVAPATAYTYFASKDHLVAEVFWRRLQRLDPPPSGGGSPAARVSAALGEIAMLVAAEPELAAASTTAVLAADPDVRRLRDQIGRRLYQHLAAALGDAADPAVLDVLNLALSGAMLQAGMGYLGYAEIAERMDRVVRLVLGSRR
jgi:AcrR family transcriptional regulator